jgi:predicted nucleotidyltransferase
MDDKDIMGVCINPLTDYFGLGQTLGKRSVHEKMIAPWDAVTYEIRKYVSLLAKCNPNVLSLLWLRPEHYMTIEPAGQLLIDNRDMFVSKMIYHSFSGYAHGQLHRMTHFGDNAYKTGYMGAKRKALAEEHGFDRKNAAHCIRLLRMGIGFLNEGVLHVWREDARELLDIKTGGSAQTCGRSLRPLYVTCATGLCQN